MTLRLSCVYRLKCRCVWGGTSGPKTPAPLKGLEGFLEVEEHEVRFESWCFLRYDSSFAFLCGKSIVVDFWVRPLELKRGGYAPWLYSVCTKIQGFGHTRTSLNINGSDVNFTAYCSRTVWFCCMVFAYQDFKETPPSRSTFNDIPVLTRLLSKSYSHTCLSLFLLSLAGSSLSAIRPSSSSCRGVWVPITFCSSDSTLLICLQKAGDALKSVSEPAYLIWWTTQRECWINVHI